MNVSWPSRDLDRFILKKLEDQGLQPVADASPSTLLRRLHFDLTGLPPTAEESVNVRRKLETQVTTASGGGGRRSAPRLAALWRTMGKAMA